MWISHSDHIRFFYEDVHLRSNDNEFSLPDYIYYDQYICGFIMVELIYKNLTCEKETQINICMGCQQ